jgi:predicted nucleotidyltransferase component of viral defense system
MIQQTAITEWTNTVPWTDMLQVEQDLIICRALIAIYNDEYLSSRLAFRGGTALHKLYLSPQNRYSEDIDLVQIVPESVGLILDRLRDVLSFLGKPAVKQKRNNNTMVFRMDSTFPPVMPLRLKVEINCKEHFNVLGLVGRDFSVNNQWFTGECKIITYHLDELTGTKLRALYQRRKGRDLFDLYMILKNAGINIENIIKCYNEYMAFSDGNAPSKALYIANMEEKIQNEVFLLDTHSLLRPDIAYNPHEAYDFVKTMLIDKLL